MRHQIESLEDIKNYVLAGNAIFTLVSKVSGVRFTFRVKAASKNNVYFVSVLTGANNQSDYTYMCTIFNKTSSVWTSKSKINMKAPSALAWTWFWNCFQKNVLPNTFEFWHEGRCGRCGRRLTTPESIKNGIGPICEDL